MSFMQLIIRVVVCMSGSIHAQAIASRHRDTLYHIEILMCAHTGLALPFIDKVARQLRGYTCQVERVHQLIR